MKRYFIERAREDFQVSAKFENSIWNNVQKLEVDLWPWRKKQHPVPSKVEVKLLYTEKYLYVRFFVIEKYILARTIDIQGKVHLDSCVEFFVSPSEKGYFNFELNCIGVPHICFRQSRHEGKAVEKKDIEKIIIATSLKKSQAISEPIQCPKSGYVVEYAAPLGLFLKYAGCSLPRSGTVWEANLYKCGDNTPEPSWGVWSEVLTPQPDFHRPEYFGKLVFK